MLHPDIQFKNISGGEVNARTAGKKEFEVLAKQSAAIFREREQKILSYKEGGDEANVELQYHAMIAVDLPNGLKCGDAIDLWGTSEYGFKDGLISSIVDGS